MSFKVINELRVTRGPMKSDPSYGNNGCFMVPTRQLSTLARAADVLAESGLEITPQLLRRKIGLAPSLLDSVTQGADVVDLARKLTDTLIRESQQRERLASRLAGRKKSAHADSEFAVPHLAEDA